MRSSSYLKIDLDKVRANLLYFSQKAAVMAMIKANAYGTDVLSLLPYLEAFGVTLIGVSHVNEGIALRKAGTKIPIFVLAAPPFEAQEIAHYQLQPAVSSFDEIEALERAAKQKLPVHLFINTGMNRFGCDPETALSLVAAIQKAEHLHLEGLMTHFASADLPEKDAVTHHQITLFKEIVDRLDPLPRWIHAANGPAAKRFSIPFCNLLRIGVSLFDSALTLESHIVSIRTPQKGETIGYHGLYTVEKSHMRVGVIPFGYHDGYHCHYKEKGYVIIHGKQAPIVGNICMDFMMVDLTSIPETQIGDRVTLFGAALPPETVASWGNTDVRELLASIGPRTKRILTRKEDEQRVSNPICPIEEGTPSGQHLLPT